MQIKDILTENLQEKEFGFLGRMKQSGKNLGNTVMGRLGSTKAANRAVAGGVEKQMMLGANKVSDAYTKFAAAKYPDSDPNTLRVSQFKEFMRGSNKLKGEEKRNYEVFAKFPEIRNAFVKEKPNDMNTDTVFKGEDKQNIFKAIAGQQIAANMGGGAPGQPNKVNFGGNPVAPEDSAKIQSALDGMTPDQIKAFMNAAQDRLA